MDDKSLLQIAAMGGVMGLGHVLSPDHLSALATLSAGGGVEAFRLGVRWGLGHSIGMVGAALILLTVTWSVAHTARATSGKDAAKQLAGSIAEFSEAMVGVVMVAVGLYGGFRATRERRRRAKESKDAGHAHHDHSHCHAHNMPIHNSRDAVLALGVGVVHGLTHIVWVLPVLQMPRLRDASAYLLAFSICSTGLMGLFAALWGVVTRHTHSERVTCALEIASSALSLAVGLAWLALLATGRLDDSVFGDHGHDHGHGHDHDHVYLHHGDPTEEERRLYHDLRGHQRRRHHRLRSML